MIIKLLLLSLIICCSTIQASETINLSEDQMHYIIPYAWTDHVGENNSFNETHEWIGYESRRYDRDNNTVTGWAIGTYVDSHNRDAQYIQLIHEWPVNKYVSAGFTYGIIRRDDFYNGYVGPFGHPSLTVYITNQISFNIAWVPGAVTAFQFKVPLSW